MGNIEYERIRQTRIENFNYLHEHLNSKFPFAMSEDDVPMVYPYYSENGIDLRAKLIENKIFVARYWPNVLEWCKENDIEYKFAKNILPLPCDQRYGEEDMERIITLIKQ